ncbi:acyltransferase [Phascolarctobacterium sp.]|uniref:acyltransferase n=1 Tax=Phascolarctobacterium sp. TaxID=2049039 RepID=UPI003866F827
MRNNIVDNLRGLCMLGVIGIHVGSLALAPNSFALYCWLEILSRYSVPAFFFISGYGLCCTDKGLLTGKPLNYIEFMKKRLQGAGLPYVAWSFFYLFYFWCTLPPGYISWNPLHVAYVLFFGLGCYHLYFMVILLWFYASYPLWRALLRFMLRHSLPLCLGALFIFQLAMNWWTTHTGITTDGWSLLAKNFFDHRLNYLPLHYLLIFMGGGLAAVYWEKFLALLKKHAGIVLAFYAASIVYIVGSAWYSFRYEGYSLLELAYTYHQLSPQGLVYTIGSLLAFFLGLHWLEARSSTGWTSYLQHALDTLSAYSMLIYFVHPLLLEWMTSFYTKFGIVMTVKKVVFSYFFLVITALIASILLTQFFKRVPFIKLLFTGKSK